MTDAQNLPPNTYQNALRKRHSFSKRNTFAKMHTECSTFKLFIALTTWTVYSGKYIVCTNFKKQN